MAKKGARVTGIDLSDVGIVIGRTMAGENGVADRCDFRVGDFTQMGLPDEHFDVVLLHEVYHHLVKYPGVKETIARVTKTGGKIIMADTVRGSGLIHLGRRLVKFFRYRGRDDLRQQDANLGDVLFTTDTYREFAEGFSYHRVYLMSYLYMIKQTSLQYHVDKFYVRWLLRLAKYADDVLLTLLPVLRHGCGEAILYIEK
jgi:ubiquinone/menaquinone biosynthesis C-methylase UbiE